MKEEATAFKIQILLVLGALLVVLVAPCVLTGCSSDAKSEEVKTETTEAASDDGMPVGEASQEKLGELYDYLSDHFIDDQLTYDDAVAYLGVKGEPYNKDEWTELTHKYVWRTPDKSGNVIMICKLKEGAWRIHSISKSGV